MSKLFYYVLNCLRGILEVVEIQILKEGRIYRWSTSLLFTIVTFLIPFSRIYTETSLLWTTKKLIIHKSLLILSLSLISLKLFLLTLLTLDILSWGYPWFYDSFVLRLMSESNLHSNNQPTITKRTNTVNNNHCFNH